MIDMDGWSSLISKEQAHKMYWEALEALIKSLKGMSGNMACRAVTGTMWEHVEHKSRSIRSLETDVKIGAIYQLVNYSDEFLIVRLDGFCCSKSDLLQARVSVIACSQKKWDYQDVEDVIEMSVANLTSNIKKEIKPNDLISELPLFLGYEFKGALYNEMIAGSTPEEK